MRWLIPGSSLLLSYVQELERQPVAMMFFVIKLQPKDKISEKKLTNKK